MDNRNYHDCPGKGASVAETPELPRQPGQSLIDKLLDRNDEWGSVEPLLRLYDADDVLELRFLHPTRTVQFRGIQRKLSVSIYRRVNDLLAHSQRLVKLLLQKMIGGYNSYFSIHPRYPITGNRASTTNDVKAIRAFALDFDNVTPDRVPELLREHQLPAPTLTVNSGYGVHLYWFLRTPLTRLGGADLFREFVRRHSGREKIRADPACKDAARILRLPGTINQQKGSRPPALCRIVEVEPERRYHPTDLLPGWEEKITAILELEPRNRQRQDRFWQERQANRQTNRQSTAPAASVNRLSLRPSPSVPSTPYIHISHGFPCTDVHDGRWDSEYVLSLIKGYPIQQAGQRHSVAFQLLVAVKRSLGRLNREKLRWIHDRWFERFKGCMSGQTSTEESWADFQSVWAWLWQTDDPQKGQNFFGTLSLVSHPGRNLLPQGRRYDRHRQLADLMYTASLRVGFNEKQFFLGIKDICRQLDVSSIKNAWCILQTLKKLGLVVQTVPGDAAKRQAACYSIPEQFRG
jgi:hypothetical protein